MSGAGRLLGEVALGLTRFVDWADYQAGGRAEPSRLPACLTVYASPDTKR
jgi:hypothetical protein